MRRPILFLLILAVVAPLAAQQRTTLPDLGGTEITLSWKDFKRLVEAGRPLPTPRPAPPREAFLRSAEYSGRLEPGVLTLDAVLRLEVLKNGWARLPLWSQGSVVRFDGGGAVLNRENGRLEVLARGPASYQLRARLIFKATDHPGENRVALRLPDAPVNLLDITAGPGLRDLGVETGLAYRALPSRIFAALAGGSATLRYTIPFQAAETEEGEVLELDPRILLASYQFLDLGDGVMGGILVNDYQVRVAKVTHFEIALPDGIEVFDAQAPGLESWKVLQRDDGRVLRVRLATPADGAVRVVVTFDGSYDVEAGQVAVPRFAPLGVERESGYVAVAADGAEVEFGLSGNLLPADVTEIPDDVRGYGGNLVTALKFAGSPAAATVAVIEHDDASVLTAIVERLNASTVLMANGTEATWVDLVVKNNRKQFLKLELPEDGVEVWSLLVDGQPTRPKRSDDHVLVPLPTGSAERTSQVSLVLLRRGDEVPRLGTVRPSLPGLDVPISEAMWTVYLPPDARYRPVTDAFRVLHVSAPFGGGDRAGGVGFFEPLMSAPTESVSDYVSKETAAKQEAQREQITQQLKARQSASRRGSLPVRIGLPGGVNSMPQVSVARILIVDSDATVLQIRVYPEWIGTALQRLRVALVVIAGLLLGLLATGRLGRRHRRWVGLAVVVALLPFGSIGTVQAVILIASAAVVAALVLAIVDRVGNLREDEHREKPGQ